MQVSTSGLLINSENFQGLNILQKKYSYSIQSIYIDPPYNTEEDRFIYKDNYQHSTWLSLLADRLNLATSLMKDNALFFISIDDRERHRLIGLIRNIFGDNILSTITVKMSHLSGMKMAHIDRKPPKLKEYLILFCKAANIARINPIYSPAKWNDVFNRYNGYIVQDEENPNDHTKWRRITLPEAARINDVDTKNKEAYEAFKIQNAERIFRTAVNDSDMVRLTPNDDKFRKVITPTGLEKYVYKQEEVLFADTFMKVIDGKKTPIVPLGDLWLDIGINNLHNEGGVQFPNGKKPLKLVKRVLELSTKNRSIILDFFAGSGTICEATMRLNEKDKGERKYIAIEMDKYFEPKLKKRTMRSIYSRNWLLDNPTSREGSSHMFKYIRLESYEDALNNIVLDEDSPDLLTGLNNYMLKYMLDWDTKDAETMLDVRKLDKPFDYKLNLKDGDETVVKNVDLPETFNYLIGLTVDSRKICYNYDRKYLVYKGSADGNKVVVIWREIEGWDISEYEQDRDFINDNALTTEMDRIYINGDSYVPDAESIDRVFKRKMFEGGN